MIHANELREGNYLNCVSGFGTVVIGLGKFELATKDRGFVSLQECSPIPLTPEILEKCGFKNASIDPDFQWVLANCILIKGTVGYYPAVVGGSPIGKNIEYVHQLQNFFYAITGKELEVKL